MFVKRFLGIVLMMLLFSPLALASAVGTVTKSRGEVEVTRENQKLPIKTKDALFVKDHVQTGPRGLFLANLNDDTKIVLGNNASMVVQELSYTEGAKDNKASLEVTKGAFRFVSGLAAKGNPDAMKVQLGKLATIGVRGTHFGGVMTENDVQVMLLRPADGSDRPTAITVTNELGSVTIDTPGLGTTLRPNQAPSAPEPMEIPILSCPMFQ
ncbi:MAG: FecR domain-containing protein [Gammaproteobacteria bacterium]|nr:FecR domain-containing protein [Gammaproteobacteria bacterium]